MVHLDHDCVESQTTASLVVTLRKRVACHPERDALIFIEPSGATAPISYGQLDRDARGIAGMLRAGDIQPGAVVILVLEHGYDLVAAFWGALYRGAVPAIFPYRDAIPHAEHRRKRLLNLVAFTSARAVICAPDALAEMTTWLIDSDTCALALDEVRLEPEAWTPPARSDEDLAYIQFSSGTTGQPKGVMLSHRAVLHHVRSMTAALHFDERSVNVAWLPFFHDMGLFTGVFLTQLNGALSVSMSPTYWLRRPQALFQAIHRYRGTMTWMPNFAFHHCLRTVREQELVGLDLSSWRILGNGSESVQAESLRRFAERFAPWGFNPTALAAGYGMAENILGVAITPLDQPPRVDTIALMALQADGNARPVATDQPDVKAIVSCGLPIPGVVVRVVDEAGQILPERQVGEIIVAGNSLFSGYFGDATLTAQVLRDGWFYTGDLGYLADGEIYVCDRKQDLIIVGGRNIFPESIEAIAREAATEHARHVVAFGVADETLGTEAAVLVYEARPGLTKEQQERLTRQLRLRISAALGVALADIYFVPRGWIQHTTSGKLARAANRAQYLAEGRRPPLSPLSPALRDNPDQLQAALLALAGQMLGVTAVQPADDFFALGGDSLTALRFIVAVEAAMGQSVPADFFRMPTVSHLTQLLVRDDASITVLQSAASETTPDQPVGRKQAHSWQHRLRQAVRGYAAQNLWQRGPTYRRLALPYAAGTKLQRYLLQQQLIQRHFFAQECTTYRQSLTDADLTDPHDKGLLLHLLANTWIGWRVQALQTPTTFGEWGTITGIEVVTAATLMGKGLIVVLAHQALVGQVVRQLLRQCGIREFAVITGKLPNPHNLKREALRTQSARQGLARLQRGGTILIAGEGMGATQPMVVPFYGRQLPLPRGFAELALHSQAAIVAPFLTMSLAGRVNIEFVPLPTPTAACAIDNLILHYRDLLSERWPQLLPTMVWKRVHYLTSLPRTRGTDE